MLDEPAPLSVLIAECEVSSEFEKENRKFVPEGALAAVVSKDAIRGELEDDGTEWTEELDSLVDFIHSRAMKVFAIVVRYVGLESLQLRKAMQLFRDGPNGGFKDSYLPVEPPQLGKGHALALYDAKRKQGRPIWTFPRVSNFCTGQWNFLIPILHVATENWYCHHFERACILPFTKRYENECERGALGQVHKYEIHPSHLVGPAGPVPCEFVAVKTMQRANGGAATQAAVIRWEQEVSILQRINCLRQDHFVRFYTAFQHGCRASGDYYIMFEWADGGNLLNLWRTDEPLTPRLVEAVVTQLRELAEALCEVHYPGEGPAVRHGDLKPANILWFRGKGNGDKVGTLKIGDWGFANQLVLDTELRHNRTLTEHGTRRYEPPEEETGLGVGLGPTTPGIGILKAPGKR
ncbi:kinase-like domain-containing protein [Staphylotrichum tortipilum]|uniref:Kinase-like domain-containing protein n=1 Tax=Staphylotrichum tortipilum TaxID=2831512 RepID=A0AAN6RSP8_9PEZI|nr:kinase-like domain-containing protein [Staphylotrichum longicolle]